MWIGNLISLIALCLSIASFFWNKSELNKKIEPLNKKNENDEKLRKIIENESKIFSRQTKIMEEKMEIFNRQTEIMERNQEIFKIISRDINDISKAQWKLTKNENDLNDENDNELNNIWNTAKEIIKN